MTNDLCDEFRGSEEQAKIRGRKNNKARAIAMYLGGKITNFEETIT